LNTSSKSAKAHDDFVIKLQRREDEERQQSILQNRDIDSGLEALTSIGVMLEQMRLKLQQSNPGSKWVR